MTKEIQDMPEWREAQRDDHGFPMKKDGEMSSEEKLIYLLEEIVALHQRVKSIESTLQQLLESYNNSR